MKFKVVLFCLLFGVFVSLPAAADAQRRDYMTDEEIEIVRDAQDIDLRIDTLIKLIDRRFVALGIDVGGWKPSSKDNERWGPAPDGTQGDLFADIKRLLQKAIDDIDNLSERPSAAPIRDLKNKDDAKLAKDDPNRFPRAVKNLAKAAERYEPALKTALDTTKEGRDKGPMLDAIQACDEILAAVGKLPPQPKTEAKPDGKKDGKKKGN